MSNENNLEHQPHYDEDNNMVYTDDDSQQPDFENHQHVVPPESEYEADADSTMNETVIVPGDSEFDAEYQTDAESSILEDSMASDSTTPDSDGDYVTESNDVSESEIVDSTPEEVPVAPVDITILHEDYTIFCPQGEEQELFQATNYINEFIDGIREDAPTLSQKNLLVLACLNLYEKMKQAQVAAQSDEETLQHASRLVEQMIDDMQLED